MNALRMEDLQKGEWSVVQSSENRYSKKFHPVISLSLLIKPVSLAILFISSLLKNLVMDSMLMSKCFLSFSLLSN